MFTKPCHLSHTSTSPNQK
uniref:Uncharacterized protein n=1 Tax=Rhizophora mucronata TaxID=61149 RepID=A0A2P2P938_RHIMU